MQRRHLLQALLPALLAPPAFAQPAQEGPGEPVHRLLAAWREPGSEAVDRCGVIEVDWAVGRVRIALSTLMPGRAHGLQGLPDGGWVVVANRPGQWLLRVDPEGRVLARHRIADDRPLRTFNGHVQPDATGRWLYTTETDPVDGSGWVSVRDAFTLTRVAQFPTVGVDPHQVLPDPQGRLLVAVGGIPRDLAGKRTDLTRMAPSLLHVDPTKGETLGRWTLADPRLSIRHIAWGAGAEPLLGVALQAEHDDPAARRSAPLLAVWDGQQLQAQPGSLADGYAGDLAAGPGGGFVLSAQKQGQGLWWHPMAQDDFIRVADLTDPCAVATWDQGRGVLMAGARGVARWHARQAPRMLPWPRPMAPDNHWVLLA